MPLGRHWTCPVGRSIILLRHNIRTVQMDPLSDVIALLRPNTAISKPISGRGAWAVRYAAHDAPGFTIALKGVCWVTFEGETPLKLETGAFLLLPTTPAFTLSSLPGMDGTPTEPM